ncbi:outer membrane beta-barrel protein [Pontibacter qinzhouensis]|uniref:Outer membrane beta-barrel protein n=1 Tax=Pontibacter qinzhouensis TaxID=2603253 RepID=A0A5C8K7K1_9BACT|nr:outer membrane beta-barrel protein [Pontibacter qinzhouensis]TXK45787.1 outer membrane beta-barrel protein [Pontibacter qinzhouensis]
MPKLLPLLLLLLLLMNWQVQAQNASVLGAVKSKEADETLPGASILLLRLSDSTKVTTITDKEGAFRLEKVPAGAYQLLIQYIGYKTFRQNLQVQQRDLNLGQLLLEVEATTMKEIEVVGQIPLGEQKGDTTIFNAAAFKVAPDASAEDLVTKLPGVVIVDGKIQAQGEEVRQVLVDGKRFFGEDADAALRNLPAEVIENIQIFDKKSDQAEFSGFDDGNRAKTINIVTKPNRRQGQFGKVAAGVGTNERYMAGASVNAFKGDRRFTFTGISNNINMQDFSAGEAPGGGMRGRRGQRGGGNSGGGGASSGISTINNFRVNYNDVWGEKIETSGTYAYTNNRNNNNTSQFRDYINTSYLNQETYNNSYNTNTSAGHQFNFRLEYKINDRNRILITPSMSTTTTDAFSRSSGVSLYDTLFAAATEFEDALYNQAVLNRSETANTSDNGSYSFNNNINFSHRFIKPGRTISGSLSTSYSLTDGSVFRENTVEDAQRPDRNVDLDQQIATERNNLSWRTNVAFAEPVGEKGRLQLEYQYSNRTDDSERLTYDLVEQTGLYDFFNPYYSNSSVSDYLTHEAKSSYQYNSEKVRVQLETQYQLANLQNKRVYPTEYEMNTTFHRVLPTAQLEYKFSKTKNLQLDYRTNTNAPSITQLQDVLDNTNPLRFRIGNPNLVQAYQHNMNLRYRSFNAETNRVFSAFITGSLVNNFITNSTSDAAPADVPAGVEILRGAQIIRPVNLNGNWNTRAFLSYGQPLKALKTNLNITGGVGYTRTPGLINNELNFSNTTNYRLGTSLSSNISEKIDFSLSSNGSYNVVTNSVASREGANNNFFNQSTQLRASVSFWKGLVYRTELAHQLNAGLSSGYNTSFTLWNMSLSKKMLKNQRGELSLSVNDVLGENLSIQRNINTNYIEDVQSTVLQRFFMMTFSYNIRKFGGASAPAQERRGDGGERGNFRQEGGGRNRN